MQSSHSLDAEVLDIATSVDRMARTLGARYVLDAIKLQGRYAARGLPLPLSIFAKLNDAGVIVR